MTNEEKKIVVDLLGSYRTRIIKLICCQESINAFNTNSDFATELEKLFKFLKNTKLTKMSFTKRISYRAFVYTKMNMLYSSAYKNLLWINQCMKKLLYILKRFMIKALNPNLICIM